MRILWLLPDLDFTSASRQACLVTPELVRAGHDVCVAVLRSSGGITEDLRSTGVRLEALSTPHDLPIRANFELDTLLREYRPDVLHTWRIPALRSLLCARLGTARVIASQSQRGGRFGWWARLAARRATIVAPDLDEATAVPLAVGPAIESSTSVGEATIVCVGRLDREHGIRDAIWAYQALEFFMPNLHMTIIGDGPDRSRLEQFAGPSPRIRFLGQRNDVANDFTRATLVCVPSRKLGGEQVALEAQAVGVPVVASRLPSLSAVIVDNETGLLVNRSDPVGLAKAMRRFIENESERNRMGTNARALIARWPTPAQVASRWAEVYERL